jgi:predicted nucleotidyltransferase
MQNVVASELLIRYDIEAMKRGDVNIPADKIRAFCHKWKITEVSLWGSVLRDDFRPDSDVDVLVSFEPEARWSLLDLVHMQEELTSIIGREVDLVEREAVERSENYIRQRDILESAEPVYVAR